MLIRMNIGAHEGKIRDVRNEEARQMIADGRATDPRVEDGSAPAPAPAVDRVPAEPEPKPAAAAAPVARKNTPKKRKR